MPNVSRYTIPGYASDWGQVTTTNASGALALPANTIGIIPASNGTLAVRFASGAVGKAEVRQGIAVFGSFTHILGKAHTEASGSIAFRSDNGDWTAIIGS